MGSLAKVILGFFILVCLLSFINRNKASENIRIDLKKSMPALKKHALLIGINKYQSSDVRNLNGCLNDIDLMKTLLAKRGFLETDIVRLADKQATKIAIIGAINRLITLVNNGDIVVIHYSGHGSQVKDNESNEEIDHYDETLVPYDYVHTKARARETSITDDTISQLLGQLTAKTDKVTLVIDACHSGGVTRGDLGTFRSDNILTDRFIEIVDSADAEKANAERDIEDTNGFEQKSAKYVLVTACRSDEKAREAKIAGKAYGILTQALFTELESVASGTQVWPDVMDNVKMNVQKKNFLQQPQLEGENKNSYIFGDNVNLDKLFVLVSPGQNNTSLVVDAGEVLGITKGSIFKVYAPGTIDFSKTDSIATIEIIETAPTTSKAKIITGAIIKQNSKAIELKHNFSGSILNIAFKGNWLGNSLQNLKSTIKTIEAVKEDNQYPHIVLYSKGDKIQILFPSDTTNILNEYMSNDGNLKNLLSKEVELWRKWHHVFSISRQNSRVKISIEVDATKRSRDLAFIRQPDYVFSDNETITFLVKNNSSENVFINFLNLRDDGMIKRYTLGQLRGHISNESIKPNEVVEIAVTMTVREGKENSLDVMKVFALTGESDTRFEHLEQNLLARDINPPKSERVEDWYTTDKVILVKRTIK